MICILAPFNPVSVRNFFKVNVDLPDINTSATSINNLVQGLLSLGKNVIVITLDFSSCITRRFDENNIHIVTVGCQSKFILSNLFPNLYKMSSLLSSELRKVQNSVSVIHAHWCYEYALAAINFSRKKTIFITVRDFAPVIYDSISLSSSVYSFFSKIYWLYKCRVFNKVINNSNVHLIANSVYTNKKLLEYNPCLCISTIPNSIEDNLLVENLPDTAARRNIVSIATSLDDKRKNLYSLLEAFSIFSKTHYGFKLVLVGNYHVNCGIHSYAKKLGISEGVVFKGRLNRRELISVIDSSIVMVHPAYEETFGNILLEAMARGVICIGGLNAGAVPYVLDNGDSGLLCDVTSAQDISNKISEAIEHSDSINNIRRNALNRVLTTYTNTSVASSHLKYYKKIILEK